MSFHTFTRSTLLACLIFISSFNWTFGQMTPYHFNHQGLLSSVMPLNMLSNTSGFSYCRSMTIGDFNGDGFEDFILDTTIFFGNTDYLPDNMNQWPYKAKITTNSCNLIYPIGDINDDGFEDVAFRTSLSSRRVIVIIFGRPGMADIDVNTLTTEDGLVIGLPSLDINLIFSVDIKKVDFNGDGISDMAVRFYESYSSLRVNILYGRPHGYPKNDSQTDPSNLPLLLDSEPVFELDDIHLSGYGFRFRYAVSISRHSMPPTLHFFSFGDLNGDGYEDIYLETQQLEAVVVYGRKRIYDLHSGWLNADMNESGLNGLQGFRIIVDNCELSYFNSHCGFKNNDYFQNEKVRRVDINGDGIGDLPSDLFVIFGRKRSKSAPAFPATFYTSSLNGYNGFNIQATPVGFQPHSKMDFSCGDFNGDGFDDLYVHLAVYQPATLVTRYIILGRNVAFPPLITLSTQSSYIATFSYTQVDYFSHIPNGTFDFNGDEKDDILTMTGLHLGRNFNGEGILPPMQDLFVTGEVSPNPTRSHIRFLAESVEGHLTDALGRRYIVEFLQHHGFWQADLSVLTPGVYVLRGIRDGRPFVSRVIKQ